MANCSKCGAPLNEGVKFCQACGAAIGEPAAPTPEPTSQPSQAYMPPATKKSKTPLIIGIVVAVIAIVIVLLLVILLGGGLGGDEGKFVGTWEYSMDMGEFGEFTYIYKFNSDKTLEVGMGNTVTTKVGNWKVEGGKLVLSSSGAGVEFQAGSFDYTFSNNDQTLTLGMGSIDVMTFTKK